MRGVMMVRWGSMWGCAWLWVPQQACVNGFLMGGGVSAPPFGCRRVSGGAGAGAGAGAVAPGGPPLRMGVGADQEDFFAAMGFTMPYSDISVPQAFELMRKDRGAVYVDVRSEEEHRELVPPKSTINIPGFETQGDWDDEDAEWTPLPDFVERVIASGISKDTPILIGVRCGSRQVQACMELADAGFTKLYNVQAGKFIQSRQTGDNALA